MTADVVNVLQVVLAVVVGAVVMVGIGAAVLLGDRYSIHRAARRVRERAHR